MECKPLQAQSDALCTMMTMMKAKQMVAMQLSPWVHAGRLRMRSQILEAHSCSGPETASHRPTRTMESVTSGTGLADCWALTKNVRGGCAWGTVLTSPARNLSTARCNAHGGVVALCGAERPRQ